MATGERRLGSSARRGMTVLGKIPAVPKPINLPSQRLENRGLDPSVEIVPRGTFSWGTGRSPPANSSSWGNVGLSSSPPINTGAWNTGSISAQPISSSDNVSGGVAQNPPRPLSAGSTRPLSAGTTRPSSASATSARAWGGTSKLDEQLQPSRFNLATVDFPTLGSEKNPNLRPQQNMAPSSRPTSADATKERNLVHTGTSLNRPTSADGSKERKLIYPGVVPADRPTSADGSLVDKGRYQSDMTLQAFPGNLSDQRHPIYIGVVGHGTAGPGPGAYGQHKDGYNIYPPLVQHGIALPGTPMLHGGDIMHPGLAQNDRYFNGPRTPRSDIERDVLVLPVDSRPGMHANYPFDFGSTHFDRSRVHNPQSSWGPSHSDRSGVYHSHHPPHGIMQIEPRPYGMETVMQHQQGNRRVGLNASHKSFGEQRAGWDGGNVVYIGSSIDAREHSVSTSGSGRELHGPDMFTASWGHEPKNSGWGNSYSGDTAAEVHSGGASSAMYEQTALLPGGPEDKRRDGKGAGNTGEVLHPVSIERADAGELGVRQNVQPYKQEETVKTLIGETKSAGPEILKKRNSTWVNESPLSGSGPSAGVQLLKMKHEDERNRVTQVREQERVGFVSTMANQRQEDNGYGKLQTKESTHVVDVGNSPKGPEDAVKSTNVRKDTPLSQRVTKENKKEDLHPSQTHESDESGCASKTCPSKVSDVDDSTSSSAVLSTPGKERNNGVSSGGRAFANATKEASADPGSNGAVGAVQARSSTLVVSQDASAGNHKAMPTAKPTFPVAPVVETVAVPSSEEEGQALNDDLNTRARRNVHSSRRPHHGRAVHESHLMDKQHANHGMVWAPVKTPTASATKDENQPNTEKAGKVRESIQHTSTEINNEKPIQPLQKHQPSESRSQRHAQQVQQMQSAASSQQAQGQQMQEHTVVSKMHHQKVEMNSKQQGQRMQQQQSRTSNNKESEHSLQQEQSTARSYKNQTLETKPSVASSHPEQEQRQSQFAASSQREVNKEEILSAKEQQEKTGGSRSSPVVDKLDGKKTKSENTIYVPRPVRNQQRQGREQEHDQRVAASNQRFQKKEERPVVEDQENQPSETSTLPVAQSSKNNDEVKSHHSRYSKQQKRRQHESSASLNAGERHASTWNKPLLEEQGEQSVNSQLPSCGTEPEDKEESKNHTRKLMRHREMQTKQSAAGNHQEHIHTTGEHKKAFVETPDSNSGESSATKSEMKLYIPTHRKQKTHQQECTTGYGGLKSQERTSEEVHLSNEKDQQYSQSPQLSGVGSNVMKDGIELYTPRPARQPHMQGHQSTAQGHRRQRIVGSVEGQALRSSSSQATVESPLNKEKEIPRHDGASDVMEPTDASCAAGNRDESKPHAVYESSQGKKEVKLYVAKPGRQQPSHQQPVANVDQGHVDVSSREGLSQEMSHRPANESCKRKEEIKRYTPKPARQQNLMEPSVVREVKPVKQTGDLSLSEEQEQQGRVNHARASEFEHVYKSRNHLTRPYKSAPFTRPQMEIQPELEDGTVNDHSSRVDETNGAATFKEHGKDRESGFYQKRGSRQRNHDMAESPNMEEAEIIRPKQYQKHHYQYQPVAQQLGSVKPREEDSNAAYEHKLNPRQKDYGQNRYREAPPRRGQHYGYGYGYGYRATDQAG